jgi:hypothetical protein
MNVGHTVLGEKPQDGSHEALQVLVDATRRRLAAIEQGNPPSVADRFGHYLIEIVYAVILGVTVSAWAILGFVVWVPLLVRATTLLAATVFYVSLFRDNARLEHAKSRVQFAVRFYPGGFAHFLAFYRQRGEPEQPTGLIEPLTTMTRGELLVECAWVVSVWVVTVLSLKAAISALLFV